MSIYKIAPTDLTFLLDGCKACFWQKVKYGVRQTRSPFPSVFNKIDKSMKAYFAGYNTANLGLPEGVMDTKEITLKSTPRRFPGSDSEVVFTGKPDVIVSFSDRSFGCIDLKTSEQKDSLVNLYSRQQHCVREMMQFPAKGDCRWVTHLGLVPVVPGLMRMVDGKAVFEMEIGYQTIAIDDQWWTDFMGGIVRMLDGEEPEPAEGCIHCELRRLKQGNAGKAAIVEPAPESVPILSSFVF